MVHQVSVDGSVLWSVEEDHGKGEEDAAGEVEPVAEGGDHVVLQDGPADVVVPQYDDLIVQEDGPNDGTAPQQKDDKTKLAVQSLRNDKSSNVWDAVEGFKCHVDHRPCCKEFSQGG